MAPILPVAALAAGLIAETGVGGCHQISMGRWAAEARVDGSQQPQHA